MDNASQTSSDQAEMDDRPYLPVSFYVRAQAAGSDAITSLMLRGKVYTGIPKGELGILRSALPRTLHTDWARALTASFRFPDETHARLMDDEDPQVQTMAVVLIYCYLLKLKRGATLATMDRFIQEYWRKVPRPNYDANTAPETIGREYVHGPTRPDHGGTGIAAGRRDVNLASDGEGDSTAIKAKQPDLSASQSASKKCASFSESVGTPISQSALKKFPSFPESEGTRTPIKPRKCQEEGKGKGKGKGKAKVVLSPESSLTSLHEE